MQSSHQTKKLSKPMQKKTYTHTHAFHAISPGDEPFVARKSLHKRIPLLFKRLHVKDFAFDETGVHLADFFLFPQWSPSPPLLPCKAACLCEAHKKEQQGIPSPPLHLPLPSVPAFHLPPPSMGWTAKSIFKPRCRRPVREIEGKKCRDTCATAARAPPPPSSGSRG